VESRRQNRQSCGDEMDALLEGPEEYIVLTRDQFFLLRQKAAAYSADRELVDRAAKFWRATTGNDLRVEMRCWARMFEEMEGIRTGLSRTEVTQPPGTAADLLAQSWEPAGPSLD